MFIRNHRWRFPLCSWSNQLILTRFKLQTTGFTFALHAQSGWGAVVSYLQQKIQCNAVAKPHTKFGERRVERLFTDCTDWVERLFTDCTDWVERLFTDCTDSVERLLTDCTDWVQRLFTDWLRMYIWWSFCSLYLLACQVRVTVGGSGFCCCVCVMSFERESTPLFIDCSQSDSFIPKSIHWLMYSHARTASGRLLRMITFQRKGGGGCEYLMILIENFYVLVC